MWRKAAKNLQNEFDEIVATYEHLVNKEDELISKAKTCEMIIDRVIQDLLVHGEAYHFLTMEALLNAMQGVQEEVLVELSLTRIQKGLQAFLMKWARDGRS
jgi:N12 class adenine-specific DNA methylase